MNLWEAVKALETHDDAQVLTVEAVIKNVREIDDDSKKYPWADKRVNEAMLHGFRVVASLLGAEPSAINQVVDPPSPSEDLLWGDMETPDPFFTGDEVWRNDDDSFSYEQTILAYRFKNGKVVVVTIERGLSDCWAYCWIP